MTMTMTPYMIEYLVSSVLVFSVGLYVYLKNRRAAANRVFGLFYLAVATWQFGFYRVFVSSSEVAAIFWVKILWIGVIFIPTLFYHYAVVFFEKTGKRPRVVFNYLTSIFFSISLFIPGWFFDGSYKYFWGYYGKAGILQYPFLAFFALTFGSGLYYWYKGYNAASISFVEYSRRRYIFLMASVGLIGAADFLPNFDIEVYPFAALPVTAALAIISYAIVNYQLMDIRTVIHKTAMWTVTSSLYVIPIGLVLFATKKQIDQFPLWLFLLMIAALFLVNIPYMRIVQPRIDQLFQRRLYDLRAILDRFIRDVAIVKSIPELSEKLMGTIRTVLYAEPTTLLLWDAKAQHYAVAAGTPCEPIDWEDPWLQHLRGREQMVELSETTTASDAELVSAAQSYATRTGAIFCLPLHRDGQLVGVVNVGPKQNLRSYSQPEREFLETLRAEVSIALTNSLLYDEVKQMSEELRQWGVQLEHKVEERTQELKAAMHQLKETESQLIQSEKLAAHGLLAAGVLHEINNPLSFSRGSLSVLKRALTRVKEASQGTMGPLLAEVERAAEIIQDGHERIAAIVHDLKTFAKRDVQGIKLSDLHQGLDATLSLLRHELGDRVKVIREFGDIGMVEADSAQINQVFLNLIHNAMQSIPEFGTITIKTWKDGERVFISVKDTGAGIDPEHLPRIFEPFFTTKPVGQGTGLGLSVSHRIVSEHGGQMTVQSVVGRGTEFVIELPVRQTVAAGTG
jgi:signal transduction histidine kinase